jgi:predicted lipoprotein with Yx(FWY)xxD motif
VAGEPFLESAAQPVKRRERSCRQSEVTREGGGVKLSHRIVVPAVALAALSAVVAGSAMAVSSGAAPVVKLRDKQFGNVLATPKHQALYYWTREKKDFKVRCTGACAKLWPPLVVKSAAVVPRKIAGIKGSFGTVTRPDGKLQVTHDRLPVYTYAHESPNQVLCDNVDGWFVVRV